jgi:hypothetical protein
MNCATIWGCEKALRHVSVQILADIPENEVELAQPIGALTQAALNPAGVQRPEWPPRSGKNPRLEWIREWKLWLAALNSSSKRH